MSNTVQIQKGVKLGEQFCDICGGFGQMYAQCGRCKKNACRRCRRQVRKDMEKNCQVPLELAILHPRSPF